MKRIGEDVVGRPRPRGLRRDVAGAGRANRRAGVDSARVLGPQATHRVASFRYAMDPASTRRGSCVAYPGVGGENQTGEDAALLAEFADFMSVDPEASASRWRSPNPVFQERLRRRLWRTHVLAHLSHRGRDGERH